MTRPADDAGSLESYVRSHCALGGQPVWGRAEPRAGGGGDI